MGDAVYQWQNWKVMESLQIARGKCNSWVMTHFQDERWYVNHRGLFWLSEIQAWQWVIRNNNNNNNNNNNKNTNNNTNANVYGAVIMAEPVR